MNRSQMYDFMDDYCQQAKRLSESKNADYADGDDPFMNFNQCGEIGIITRMTDKVTRLKNLIFREFQTGTSNPAVDESIEDTLMDLFNYSWLLAAFREAHCCDEREDLTRFVNPMIDQMFPEMQPLNTLTQSVMDMDPGIFDDMGGSDLIDNSELTPPPAVELDYDIEAFTAALGRYIDSEISVRPVPSDFPSGGDIKYCLHCGDLTCYCGCGYCLDCERTRS